MNSLSGLTLRQLIADPSTGALVVVTQDPAKLERIVQEECLTRGLATFCWDRETGLSRSTGARDSQIEVRDPLRLLLHLEEVIVDSVFLLKGFSDHWDEPATRDQLREMAMSLRGKGSCLVIPAARPCPAIPLLLQSVISVHHMGARAESLADRLRPFPEMRRGQPVIAVRLREEARSRMPCAVGAGGLLSVSDVQPHQRRELSRALDQIAHSVEDQSYMEYFSTERNSTAPPVFRQLRHWLSHRNSAGFFAWALEGSSPGPLIGMVAAQELGLPSLQVDVPTLMRGTRRRGLARDLDNLAKMVTSSPLALLHLLQADHWFGPLSIRDWASPFVARGIPVLATAHLDSIVTRNGVVADSDPVFFVSRPRLAERIRFLSWHLRLRCQDPNDFELHALARATDGLSERDIEDGVVGAMRWALDEERILDSDMLINHYLAMAPESRKATPQEAGLRDAARKQGWMDVDFEEWDADCRAAQAMP